MVVPETEIVVTQDGAEIVRKTVQPGDYVIGRDGNCDLPVAGDTVSGRHAQLTINYDHALIEDLGSDSGTFVNGQRVTTATRLWPSQKIQVGAATITLRRKRTLTDSEQSLAPRAVVVRRLLPEEILREQKYDIGGQIARGGMGAILSAKEIAIRREVAMKVMLGSGVQEELLRFVEEAQITGQLEHPNIVPVHELSVDENDHVFYTMKMVHGVTLRQVLDQLAQGDAETVRKYPLSALLTVFQKVCDALAFAHSKGVIHRDLKPDNIMLGDYGEVLVMDWGLAKNLGATRSSVFPTSDADPGRGSPIDRPPLFPSASSAGTHPSDAAASRTLAGSIMGTPQYMAPEQARGKIDALDARSDIYALGAILYHMLTLHSPVEGATLAEILAKVSASQFVPPIQRALHAKPYPSAPAPKPNRPVPQAIDPDAPTLVYTGDAEPPGIAAAEVRLPRGVQGGRAETDSTQQGRRGAASLPHLPGGRVPESLNAVVLKAMALEQTARYQSITEFQADLTAYQTGFATRAENASLKKQIILLIKRHPGVFSTAAAAWLIVTALAVWFVLSIRTSERKATHNATIAEQNAHEAQHNARIATENEQKAVQEKENTRRALAKSQIALAEGAFREGDGQAMQTALNAVPDDLRDTNWNYLLGRSDTSIGLLRARSAANLSGIAANPQLPGVFALGRPPNLVALRNVAAGEKRWDTVVTFPDKTTGSPILAFSPDGTRIAVGKGETGGLLILDASNGQQLLAWAAPRSFSLEFSPDGKALLQCKGTDDLNVWDSSTGRLLWTNQSKGSVRAIYHPDGTWIGAFSNTEKLRLLDSKTGAVLSRLPNPPANILCLAATADGRLAYADEFGNLRVLNTVDGHIYCETHAANGVFAGLAFTLDGKRLVSLTNLSRGRQALRIWDSATGKLLDSLLGGSSTAHALAVHPLSGEIAVAGEFSKVWRLPAPPREVWTSPTGVTGPSENTASWGWDDLILYPGNGYVRAATLNSDHEKPKPIWKSEQEFNRVSVSRDGRVAIVGQSAKRGMVAVLHRSGPAIAQTHQFEFNPNLFANNRRFRLSPSGDRLAGWLWSNRDNLAAEVWGTETGGKQVRLDTTGLVLLNDVGWLGNGERIVALATAGKGRGIPGSHEQMVLWDAENGRRLQTIESESALNCLAVAPDGASFAEAGADRIVRLRDAQTLEVRQAFRAHDEAITALAFHPTVPILATGSEDLTVKLWNLDTGRLLEEVHGPKAPITQLAFTGTHLACAALDRQVRVWELDSLKPEAALPKTEDVGWEDLIANMTSTGVAKFGHGWSLNNGTLFSPNGKNTLSLPGDFARTSYELRLKVRHTEPGAGFHVFLPVAGRETSFRLDGFINGAFWSSLRTINGTDGRLDPAVVKGQLVKDAEQHDLTLSVHLDGASVRVAVRLDDQPVYEWSGPVTALDAPAEWPGPPPGAFGLGTPRANWVVYAVKVKRLK